MKWRAWRVLKRAAKAIKLRSVEEVLIKYKESVRAQMKSGREENCKDLNYHAGAVDILKWLMKER
uniref:Uncharacterized protein n=1 Tax=viral metagenome TaxID=1070528 RepID=A0A6M3XJ79_9ZZZZ